MRTSHCDIGGNIVDHHVARFHGSATAVFDFSKNSMPPDRERPRSDPIAFSRLDRRRRIALWIERFCRRFSASFSQHARP